jgi:DNA-binding protein HU-beta
MNMVTKVEFVSKVAEKTGKLKADVEKFMDAVYDTVSEAVKEGREVPVFGLGKFKQGVSKARTQVTPKGQKVDIPAKKLFKFVASKRVKDLLNQ